MKPKHLSALALIVLTAAFSSCKKEQTAPATSDEVETTLQLSTDQAIADNLTEDAHNVFMEAAVDNNLTGQKPATALETMGILGCASISVQPLMGFPKTITIDFGAGCISSNGINRKGKINIVLSDSVRKPGSKAVLTFDNYFVTGFKKEGVISWTNTSTASQKSWERKIENGKITAPTGRFWMHNGLKNVVQTAGYATPRNLLDDSFLITGNHSITNAAGASRTSLIIDPLEKKTACDNISKGSIKVQGPNHYAVINFGEGTCDKNATVAIDGGTPIQILLW